MFIYRIYFSIKSRHFIMIILYIWNNIFFILKKNMMCQDSNRKFNYRIKFIFN